MQNSNMCFYPIIKVLLQFILDIHLYYTLSFCSNLQSKLSHFQLQEYHFQSKDSYNLLVPMCHFVEDVFIQTRTETNIPLLLNSSMT